MCGSQAVRRGDFILQLGENLAKLANEGRLDLAHAGWAWHSCLIHQTGTCRVRRVKLDERCVDGAPLNSEETGPDISLADFVFCMTAITPEINADQRVENRSCRW